MCPTAPEAGCSETGRLSKNAEAIFQGWRGMVEVESSVSRCGDRPSSTLGGQLGGGNVNTSFNPS